MIREGSVGIDFAGRSLYMATSRQNTNTNTTAATNHSLDINTVVKLDLFLGHSARQRY